MKKRFLSITLVLCMLLLIVPLTPVVVNASTTTYTLKNGSGDTLQYSSGGSYANVSTTGTNPVQVRYGNSSFTTDVTGYVLNGGNTGATYKLGADMTITQPLIIRGGTKDNPVTLDLCGNVLKYSNTTTKNSVIVVADGAYFTLTDSNSDKDNKYSYTIVNDSDPNAFKLYTPTDTSVPANASNITGGVITGGTGTVGGKLGGGVFVGQNATFSMTGGNIVGCTASSKGGGVYVSMTTTFTMSGGSIVGCTATEASSNGGGVHVVGGIFNMKDSGSIVGCTANDSGGVYVGNSGAFNMTGGNIEDCTADSRSGNISNGGGLYVSDSTFTIEGGNIKNCTAGSNGGGLYVSDSTFTIEGGNIENCKAAENGGGVYVAAGTMDAKGGSVGSSVYLNGSSATLINTSGGDGTTFADGITNNGGNTKKPTKDNAEYCPADPQKRNREFLGWFVKNTSGNGYTKVEFDSDGKTTKTGDILRAFWVGDFVVHVSWTQNNADGYYTNFTDAWNAGTEGCEFKFLKDVNVAINNGTLSLNIKTTFDLNGKTVSGDIEIDCSGAGPVVRSLIVKDTANGGKLSGTVTVSGNLGQLDIWSGTVNKVKVSDGGKVNCAGGTITTAIVNTGGTLNCNSGTIKSLTVTEGTVNHTGGAATCAKQAKCDVCGHSYGDLAPTNHASTQLLLIPGKEADCKNGGNNDYYYCTSCNKYFKDAAGTTGTTAEAEKTDKNLANHEKEADEWTTKNETQHKKEWTCCHTVTVELENHEWNENGICTECGYGCIHSGGEATCKSKAKCEHCGNEYGEVDATNHTTLKHIEAKAATANALGNIEHWHCSGCNKYFSDSACKNELSSVEDTYLYAVIFNTDGGNAVDSKTAVKWEDTVLDGITDPIKSGYEFKGWKCGTASATDSTKYSALAANKTTASVELTAQWKDVTAPTGEITLGSNGWKTFLNNITFGLFFKDTQEITITATDNDGEDVKIEYLLSDKELTAEELATATFTDYSDKFTVEPNNEYVIYAKLSDETGNVAYINSNGIVLDNVAPVILGITNGETYCAAQTVTVSDKYEVTVTVNDEPVTLTNGQFTLSPAESEQKIVVTDKAGNQTEMTVTVNDGHTGGTATCTEKAECELCGEKYGEVDSNNHSNLKHIEAKAATTEAEGNIEYWHCEDCDKYFSDKDGKNVIDLKDTVISKLPPEIIDGKGQSLTIGETRELTFRSNAAYSDFIRVEVDGKTVDGKNYTVKEGSTIVTLKADYVATLSVGEHTLGIVSESGTATTAFTVNAKAVNDNTAPATGDNSHMALWFALLFVSGGALIGTTVYGKKKKYSAK